MQIIYMRMYDFFVEICWNRHREHAPVFMTMMNIVIGIMDNKCQTQRFVERILGLVMRKRSPFRFWSL